MDAREDIKILLLKNNMTMTELAKKMSGYLGKDLLRTTLSRKLTNGTLRYDELAAICDILGYDLIYKKRN